MARNKDSWGTSAPPIPEKIKQQIEHGFYQQPRSIFAHGGQNATPKRKKSPKKTATKEPAPKKLKPVPNKPAKKTAPSIKTTTTNPASLIKPGYIQYKVGEIRIYNRDIDALEKKTGQ